jgi:hypothetical protein
LVQITAATWIDATSYDRDWQQDRDTPRIRGAFSTLARICDSWPSPRKFLEALPPSSQLRITGAGERPADPPELVATLRNLKPGERVTSIAEAVRALGKGHEPVSREQREAAEAELAAMRDRKSQAAGADA